MSVHFISSGELPPSQGLPHLYAIKLQLAQHPDQWAIVFDSPDPGEARRTVKALQDKRFASFPGITYRAKMRTDRDTGIVSVYACAESNKS